MGVQQVREMEGEERYGKASSPKRRASPPRSPLAHYIPAHFPHHFSNDSPAKGYIAREDPLFFPFVSLFFFFMNLVSNFQSAGNSQKNGCS